MITVEISRMGSEASRVSWAQSALHMLSYFTLWTTLRGGCSQAHFTGEKWRLRAVPQHPWGPAHKQWGWKEKPYLSSRAPMLWQNYWDTPQTEYAKKGLCFFGCWYIQDWAKFNAVVGVTWWWGCGHHCMTARRELGKMGKAKQKAELTGPENIFK